MHISTYEIKDIRLTENRDMMHKLVMTMFDKDRSTENVLFMIHEEKITVRSDKKPKSPPEPLILLNMYDVSSMLSRFLPGSVLTIYGMFEPTICQNGRKNLIRNKVDRIKWVQRKFSNAGCLLSINEVSQDNIRIMKNSGDKRRSSFFGYIIEIQILDSEKFKELFRHGIGRSKAYGAGMSVVLNDRN